MDLNETVLMLRYVNNFDARVQFNEPSVEMWQKILAPVTPGEARQAIEEHYMTNGEIAATAAGIRKRALNIRERIVAKQSALTATPSTTEIKNPNSYRVRNPEIWERLFEEGRRQANEERARNGAKFGVGLGTTDHDGELHDFPQPNYTGMGVPHWADEPAA